MTISSATHQEMWAERNRALSQRVRELEAGHAALGKQRRVQRVLRALAQAASRAMPAQGRQPEQKIRW